MVKLNLPKQTGDDDMHHKKPTVFISYNQKSGDAIADQIQNRLDMIAYIVRDKSSIPEWGSIEAFMKSIREQDLVVMIITTEYLKSFGCMYEVVEAMKDESWNQHTMFVVADDVMDIYTYPNWEYYLEYWKKKESELEHSLKSIGDSAITIKYAEKLRKIREIETALFEFLDVVADSKNPNIKEAVEKIYQRVNKYISGTKDLERMLSNPQMLEQMDAETLYCLGRCYEMGEAAEQDYGKAAFYYHQAAELGHIRAQCCLGIMYEQAIGVEYSDEKALYWFREAAELGDSQAQYLLGGKILRQSKGSEAECLKAIEWYQKAAEQNYIPAQKALSEMYKNGSGVEQDYEQADYWFQRAYQLTCQFAEQGDCDSQCSLAFMYSCGDIRLEKDEKVAAEWYKKAAEQGSSDAQFYLGKMFAKGEGVSRDFSKAIKWYEKAVAQKHTGALLCLGDMYKKGEGIEKNILKAQNYYKIVEELLITSANRGLVSSQKELARFYTQGRIGEVDYDKAIYWYKKAIAWGDIDAMVSLGEMYRHKANGNYEKAIKWMRKAASQGSAYAMYSLGTMYKTGNGVEQSYDKAISWYQKAAEQGYFLAIERLGEMYELGLGTDSNMKKAVALYMQHAYRGINYARWRLGYLYQEGLGVVRDYGEAVRWYQVAAKHGYRKAQCSLACMYIKGDGVFKDIDKAIYWFERAAEFEYGDSFAQYALGVLYLCGDEVEKDYNMAFKWFQKAEKLNSDAQAYLGYMYENGYGVEQDYETAFKWYYKSAKESDIGQFWLGLLYEMGKGMPQSDKEAAYWYQKAANLGNFDAMEHLGKIYEKKGECEKANEWYKKAKEQA